MLDSQFSESNSSAEESPGCYYVLRVGLLDLGGWGAVLDLQALVVGSAPAGAFLPGA